jgi:hypothetical protein
MAVVVEGLTGIIEAVNAKGDNPVTTMVVQSDGTIELTFEKGLTQAFSQQSLENAYAAPAVMGAGDPTVQSLENLYGGDIPVAEVSAQAEAAKTITDTLDMHLQHTEQAEAGITATATAPTQTLEQLAASAPTAPEVLKIDDLEVQVVQQSNQPPIIAVKLPNDPDFEKVEAQLNSLVESQALQISVPEVMADIKAQYAQLVQNNAVDAATPTAEMQQAASIEANADLRRRPVEAAEASPVPATALQQMQTVQHQGIAMPMVNAADIRL